LKYTGLDIKTILTAAGKQRKDIGIEGREGNAKKAANHIEEVMKTKRELMSHRSTTRKRIMEIVF
jgi:hypothetical protein